MCLKETTFDATTGSDREELSSIDYIDGQRWGKAHLEHSFVQLSTFGGAHRLIVSERRLNPRAIERGVGEAKILERLVLGVESTQELFGANDLQAKKNTIEVRGPHAVVDKLR